MLEFYCLTAQQKRTLRLLSELCDRSVSENPVFAHYVLSLSGQQKAADDIADAVTQPVAVPIARKSRVSSSRNRQTDFRPTSVVRGSVPE